MLPKKASRQKYDPDLAEVDVEDDGEGQHSDTRQEVDSR